MARFLYLIWPRTYKVANGESSIMLWLSWFSLLAAGLIATWLMPIEDPVTLWSIKTLASNLWPIILGTAAAGLTLWGYQRGFRLNRLSIPPGDILVIAEALLNAIPWPRTTQQAHQEEYSTKPQTPSVPVSLATTEYFAGQWPVAICLFLIMVLWIFGLLAWE